MADVVDLAYRMTGRFEGVVSVMLVAGVDRVREVMSRVVAAVDVLLVPVVVLYLVAAVVAIAAEMIDSAGDYDRDMVSRESGEDICMVYSGAGTDPEAVGRGVVNIDDGVMPAAVMKFDPVQAPVAVVAPRAAMAA